MKKITFEDLQFKSEQMMTKVGDFTALIVEKVYRSDITLRNICDGRDYWISVVGGHKCFGDGISTFEVAIFNDMGVNVTHKFYKNVEQSENVAPFLSKSAVTMLMQSVIDSKISDIIF